RRSESRAFKEEGPAATEPGKSRQNKTIERLTQRRAAPSVQPALSSLSLRLASPTRRHLLRHGHQKLPVGVRCFAQTLCQLVKIRCLLALASPHDVVRGLSLKKIRQLGRFLAVVKQLVQRDFESPRQLLQRLNGRHGVPVLDARDITPQQACSLLDISLRKLLFLPQFPQTIADDHAVHPSYEWFLNIRLHQAHGNTDDAPDDFGLTGMRKPQHLIFGFWMRNHREVPAAQLAPAAEKSPAEFYEVDRPIVLIFPAARQHPFLVLVDLHDRARANNRKHSVVA